MPPHGLPEFPAVPIIGQIFDVGEANVSVIGTCKCRPDNKPFLLSSVDITKICAHCGNVYAIMETKYQRGRMHAVQCVVSMVGNRKDFVEKQRAQFEAAVKPSRPT